MEELDYDLQSFEVYRSNVSQHESQCARQQVAWSKKLADEGVNAAEAYLARHAAWMNSVIKP